MTSKKNNPTEFELIRKYFSPLVGSGSFELLDDATEFSSSPGSNLVITQDAVAESIHFFADDAASNIARKAIRVNISDLIAKGAKPRLISIALGLGLTWNETWIRDFAEGVSADCAEFMVDLSGGDTFVTQSGYVVSVTAIGEVPQGCYTSRLGAKPGDLVYVTGTIGDGVTGLTARKGGFPNLPKEDLNYLRNRYLLPRPRTELIEIIRNFATASMDVSDGLVADGEKLAFASNLSLNIESAKVPLSKPVSRLLELESTSMQSLLSGGDDYEILFTASTEDAPKIEMASQHLPFPISCIGTVTEGTEIRVFDSSGDILEFESKGFDHTGTGL